ncbi:unnamed protein product [Brachionus calyciflorus]|uniref:Uncharacterized protein n=1 Tax=Brachionus calyciflorus TaxID=104777 RepID=A0A814CWN9_9BILA|nr:unnamed protein product [Brachionus calyciflorus]
MKAQLYKIYIRLILWYGIEAFNIKKSDILALKRFEGNIVKKILGISNKCKTTDLFNALKLETTRERMNKIKVDFYYRLYENDFTKKLLEYMELSENPNDYINELYE